MIVECICDYPKLYRYATKGSAGMDLITIDSFHVDPGQVYKVHTGLRINIQDKNVFALLAIRSGVASKGLSLINGVGIIDQDYHGEIMLMVRNNNSQRLDFSAGNRIGQLIFMSYIRAELQPVFEFTQYSSRDEGGFGSTGV